MKKSYTDIIAIKYWNQLQFGKRRKMSVQYTKLYFQIGLLNWVVKRLNRCKVRRASNKQLSIPNWVFFKHDPKEKYIYNSVQFAMSFCKNFPTIAANQSSINKIFFKNLFLYLKKKQIQLVKPKTEDIFLFIK